MNVIKRNGTEVIFNKDKIFVAISKANNEVEEKDKLSRDEILSIANDIENIASSKEYALTVEDIQDMVEEHIVSFGKYNLAKAYIIYRYKHSELRDGRTALYDRVQTIVDNDNEEIKQENSNKNSYIISVQRDYIAGEVSKDMARERMFSKRVMDAHDAGLIHKHDLDYAITHEHNCFHKSTEIVTDLGVRRFDQLNDGQIIRVKDRFGLWRQATVHMYGKQKMQFVTLICDRIIKTVRCTTNHRWLLEDGTDTTELRVGDKLAHLPESIRSGIINKYIFCLGFILGDGCDGKNGVRTRLSGEKTKYAQTFIDCGYNLVQKLDNGDLIFEKLCEKMRDNFINNHCWRYLSKDDIIDLFNGFYAAVCEYPDDNKIYVLNDDNLIQMIREISAVAGYYIASETMYIRDARFRQNDKLYEFVFITNQPNDMHWVVDAIKVTSRAHDAWCVEEPITHTFTLANGMVTGNCDLINLDDMLQNGTVISGTKIDTPHSFSTACNVATQIIAQVASSQFGGQSFTLTHLLPFVKVSRERIREEVTLERKLNNEDLDGEKISNIVEPRVKKEIKSGIQTIQYQLITLQTTNGQAPFVTLLMYLNEVEDEQEKEDLAYMIKEVLEQRIQGVKNEQDVWVSPAFPKLIYVLEEDNAYPGSKYYYLTELAAKCTAKRLVPDYISEKKLLEYKYPAHKLLHIRDRRDNWGKEKIYGVNPFKNLTEEEIDKLQEYVEQTYVNGNKEYDDTEALNIMKKYNIKKSVVVPKAYTCMGCRSFLTPDYIHYRTYSRFNQGVCTINLVDVALSSGGDFDKFWEIFDDRLDICYEALLTSHKYLEGTLSDVAPILWQYGALARLDKGETIDELLHNNYSTISLGYAGLYECVKYMTGKSHTDEGAKGFAVEVMQHMNDKCEEWRLINNVSFSLYGTPLESTTYKFAKSLQKRFGRIEGITDRNYITNSYHFE